MRETEELQGRRAANRLRTAKRNTINASTEEPIKEKCLQNTFAPHAKLTIRRVIRCQHHNRW